MADRDPLTARQQQALDFIRASILERGFPPTLREIGEHMGIRSTNGVNDHLKALEKKGYLVREDLKSRALRPVDLDVDQRGPVAKSAPAPSNDNTVGVPLVGRVAAGLPILAQENVEETIQVDPFLVGRHQNVFALQIQGDSMIDDGIHDGDYIFVRKTNSADPGEIVVALIDDEATCKRYYPEGDRIRLQPANASMKPIYVSQQDSRSVSLLGIVVGVYRQMS